MIKTEKLAVRFLRKAFNREEKNRENELFRCPRNRKNAWLYFTAYSWEGIGHVRVECTKRCKPGDLPKSFEHRIFEGMRKDGTTALKKRCFGFFRTP